VTEGADADASGEETVVAVAVAVAAGVAIDNVRLYAAGGYRQRWLEATAEITNALLGEVRRTAALQLVARRAREVSRAESVLVLLYDEDTDQLTVEVTDPERPELCGATVPSAGTVLGTVITGGRAMIVDDLGAASAWPAPVSTGATLITPLAASGSVQGLLAVAHAPGGAAFDDMDISLLPTFAGQAALALERARAQEEREMLVVLEDRERIARDLHDVVIQRLFATGLQLQSASRLASRPEVAERISTAVDDLDATIRDIRSAIFELRSPVGAVLRADIHATVQAAGASLGFRPGLRLDGPIDSAGPDEVRADLLAVLREALSNVVRHARSSRVDVHIAVGDGRLRLAVSDDGVGSPDPFDERSGLANMRQRADRLGGILVLAPGRPAGTVVNWSIPVG
jgi:signal transduction histidine kinase